VLRIYLRECLAYPAATFIWMLADAQTAMILPAVWLACAGDAGAVAGMSRPDLVTYYLASMVLTQFITCHLMWDIGWDIREGDFNAHLLRPMSYFRMNLARNLAWRWSKLLLFLPVAAIVFLIYSPVGTSPVHVTWPFVVSVLLAQTLSYVSGFCVAMTALWTTEFMSTFRLYYLPEMFLSGRLVPLSTLPVGVAALSTYTHFRYMNYFCVEILMGKLAPPQILSGILIQVAWIGGFTVLARVLFLAGTRRYVGAGM
jgi:ABC-2 type transport system permease protein